MTKLTHGTMKHVEISKTSIRKQACHVFCTMKSTLRVTLNGIWHIRVSDVLNSGKVVIVADAIITEWLAKKHPFSSVALHYTMKSCLYMMKSCHGTMKSCLHIMEGCLDRTKRCLYMMESCLRAMKCHSITIVRTTCPHTDRLLPWRLFHTNYCGTFTSLGSIISRCQSLGATTRIKAHHNHNAMITLN